MFNVRRFLYTFKIQADNFISSLFLVMHTQPKHFVHPPSLHNNYPAQRSFGGTKTSIKSIQIPSLKNSSTQKLSSDEENAGPPRLSRSFGDFDTGSPRCVLITYYFPARMLYNKSNNNQLMLNHLFVYLFFQEASKNLLSWLLDEKIEFCISRRL